MSQMKQELISIPVGMTRVVNGCAVTRWTEKLFEVGTWGTDQLVELWDAMEMVIS